MWAGGHAWSRTSTMTQGEQLQLAVETGDVAELERLLGDDPSLAHRDVRNKLRPLQLTV